MGLGPLPKQKQYLGKGIFPPVSINDGMDSKVANPVSHWHQTKIHRLELTCD